MPLVSHLALVSETDQVSLAAVTRVAAALQKQVARDLAPVWDVHASVSAFDRLEDVPVGYWPMIVVADVPNAAGVHLDRDGQPYALIEAGRSWSLTASHECLEMLVDPFGDRLVAGPSHKRGQGRVEFLVEVCDPSEDARFGYTVNGILVSDFYTPAFFDPVAASGVRYSFGGHIRRPRSVLEGGYLSWHDPVSDHWWQQTWFGGAKPAFRDLGTFSARDPRSLREIVDAQTPEMHRLSHLDAADASWLHAAALAAETEDPCHAKAAHWRKQIQAFRRSGARRRPGRSARRK